jgi:FKBP12-rapamycin complex-associated protein
VNALLYHDKRTENLDLSIRRYAVLPLSPSAGLISWVHNCDTLHVISITLILDTIFMF